MKQHLTIRQFDLQPYQQSYTAMQQFTHERCPESDDEIWLLQHPAVFTQGKTSKAEHFLAPTHLPIINSNRGGKVTYHGPGQLIGYCLIDMRRRGMHIRQLVDFIEQSLLQLLADNGTTGHLIAKQPGVYVKGEKIASLGLRVHKGCSYHGFSLNVAMDLQPFSLIQPCGLADMQVTQLANLGCEKSLQQIASEMALILEQRLPQCINSGD
ncbi:MAG: lipoyl(octanoyl) transferase LipB [Gammaproteobacteria bacterium]|nr:lipoyl(octanoyl) transferase LipB [Gammaproteobacteria bacterium]MCP4473835.1 lipoyl(octanoyl) transferase LipB [Gammaproteobacteria bacterium]